MAAVKPGRYVLASAALFVALFLTAVLVLTLLGAPTVLNTQPLRRSP